MSRSANRLFGTLLLLTAGLAAPASPAGAHWLWFGRRPPPPVDSPVFAVRAPPPGRPGYLATIGYIDNGLKYVDAQAAFFVSYYGRMCFVGVLNVRRTTFERRQFPWCVAPSALADIEVVENDITYVPQLRLWCRHAAPQCFQEAGRFDRRADSISVEIVPAQGEKDAVAYLIYLMGGRLMGGRVPADRPWRD
ncbi:MAG: hypothetical protein ACREE1_02470 [Stellaceae bacterium]